MLGKRRSGELHGHDPMRRLRRIPRLRPQARPRVGRLLGARPTRLLRGPRTLPSSPASIGHLYRVEARLRKSDASPKLRAVVRSAQSAPVLARIIQILEEDVMPPAANARSTTMLPPIRKVFFEEARAAFGDDGWACSEENGELMSEC